MELNSKSKWVLIVCFSVIIILWVFNSNLKEKIISLQSENYSLEEQVQEYSDALDQANANIEDAQAYAWGSYEDMGYTLENLETVEP